MKIREIQARAVVAPLDPPVRTASGHVTQAPIHLLAVTPTCHYIEYLDVAAPILAEPLRPVDGTIQAPARPGLGLQWNEEAVARYRA